MKKILLSIVSLLGFAGLSAQTAPEPVEIDGLYYRLSDSGENHTATVVKPTDGEYSGSITLPSSVSYGGTDYTVTAAGLSSVFSQSSVTDFTLGEGWEEVADQGNMIIWFYQDAALEKITLKSFCDNDRTGTIRLGTNYGTVQAYLRKVDETTTQIIVEKFNVYGPDGEKLKPYLVSGGDRPGYETRYYPDENGIITLGADWKEPDGNYCGVLQLGSGDYWLVLFYVEYQGRYFAIRLEPTPNHTGQYTEIDGMRYMFNSDHLILTSPAEGSAPYSGEIEIPATGLYEGEEYPINEIDRMAFANSDIKSINLPASITAIGNEAFYNCQELETVDMSACTGVEEIRYIFSSDPVLSSVKLPEGLKIAYTPFRNCPVIADVELPEGLYLSGICTSSPALFNPVLLSNYETEVKVKAESTVRNWAGNLMEIAVTSPVGNTYTADAEGVFTIPREDFYVYNEWTEQTRFNGYLYFVAANENDGITGTIASLSVKEKYDEPAGLGETMTVAGDDAPEYYTISGVRVCGTPTAAGIYIRRYGSKAEKVVIR